MPAFRQNDVADTLMIVEIVDAILMDPSARQIENSCAFGVACRCEVVGYHHDFGGISHVGAKFLEDRLNPAGPAGIVHHGKIDGAGDNLTRCYARTPSRPGYEFFS